MISQDEKAPKPKERLDGNPSSASKGDLYGYGVAAKISGVEGRGTGEFALLVEGVARIRIDKITQDKPFFEAEVTYEHDDGECVKFKIVMADANTKKPSPQKMLQSRDSSLILSSYPASS